MADRRAPAGWSQRRLLAAAVVVGGLTLLLSSGSGGVALSDSDAESVTVSAAWVLDEVSDDGRMLVVRHRSGGCYAFDRADVEERSEMVTVTVFMTRPAAPVSCPPPAVTSTADVALTDPLGERSLAHGPVTPDTPVSEPPRAGGRLEGPSRIETAVAVSRHQFPDGATVVYLAREDVPADAVTAGSLTDGPVLLVPRCAGVPAAVTGEIVRLDPDRVFALGGDAAVCPATLDAATAS